LEPDLQLLIRDLVSTHHDGAARKPTRPKEGQIGRTSWRSATGQEQL